MVVATRPFTKLWSLFTPPLNSKVHMGPFKALPTIPFSNWTFLKERKRKKKLKTQNKYISHSFNNFQKKMKLRKQLSIVIGMVFYKVFSTIM